MRLMITKTPNGGYILSNPDAPAEDLMAGIGIYAAVSNLEEAIEAVGNVLIMDPDSVHHSTMNLQMKWVDHAAPVHPYPEPQADVGPLVLDEAGFLGAEVYDDSVKQAEIAGLVPSERGFTADNFARFEDEVQKSIKAGNAHKLEVAPHQPKKDLRPGDVDHDTEH